MSIKGTDLHYRNHLSAYSPQRNMERFTITDLEDMNLLYGLKQLVKEAEKLLKIRDRSPREEILLKKILDELDFELTGDEIIETRHLKPPRRYLGSPEPMLSIFEHKLKEEEHRRKALLLGNSMTISPNTEKHPLLSVRHATDPVDSPGANYPLYGLYCCSTPNFVTGHDSVQTPLSVDL
ncbi:uncharacterized protein TNCV_4949041 [Trichonephila clavipes]|nr:uncharacterized protein TNCV_4949041 [Trichonephila clavipes]